MTQSNDTATQDDEFRLDASDEQLLDEFGLLMAAEYYFMTSSSLASVGGPAVDPMDALVRFGPSGSALKMPHSTLERRFSVALENEARLRG